MAESGAHRQVSRLGNPLANEQIIPRKGRDKFSSSQPSGDGQSLSYVLDTDVMPCCCSGWRNPAVPNWW